MRITGGEWCGRKLRAPSGSVVRPTLERVREALFSVVMGVVPGAVFVDLYAGSGAVGLEALSRGARRVVWVEHDRGHVAQIKSNLEVVGGEGEVYCADVLRWVGGRGRGLGADIVFADPPYDYEAREMGEIGQLMQALAAGGVIAEGGLFIVEVPMAVRVVEVEGWSVKRDKAYGKTRLILYRQDTKEQL